MNNIETVFEGNWDIIKGKLKKQWGKLSDDDIKQIDGSFDEFVGKVKKTYGKEASKIESEIIDFLDDNNLHEVQSKIRQLPHEAMAKAEQIKDMVHDCVVDYFAKLKKTKAETEENVAQYYKNNPLKSAGFIFAAGFVLAKLLTSKK